MDLATILGLVVAIGSVLGGTILEGGSPASLYEMSAALIVVGGTIGATLVSFPMSSVAKLPKLLMKAFFTKRENPASIVELFGRLAEKARREGLLSLEEESSTLKDDFLRKGIMLVVDGTDPELVKSILEIDIEALQQRHGEGQAVLNAMGGYAPTMGIIGTVMGLVNVLSHMDDPSRLGESVAVAFIATLYGIITANVLWLPMAGKLKMNTEHEVLLRRMAMEGILSVQAGENPRILRDKLVGFLAPGKKGSQKQEAAAAAMEPAMARPEA